MYLLTSDLFSSFQLSISLFSWIFHNYMKQNLSKAELFFPSLLYPILLFPASEKGIFSNPKFATLFILQHYTYNLQRMNFFCTVRKAHPWITFSLGWHQLYKTGEFATKPLTAKNEQNITYDLLALLLSMGYNMNKNINHKTVVLLYHIKNTYQTLQYIFHH